MKVNSAAIKANRNLEKVSETLNYKYDESLKEQEVALSAISDDRSDFATAIFVKTKVEMQVHDDVNRLMPYMRSEVIRQISDNLRHKADCIDRMDKEVGKANKMVSDEIEKSDE